MNLPLHEYGYFFRLILTERLAHKVLNVILRSLWTVFVKLLLAFYIYNVMIYSWYMTNNESNLGYPNSLKEFFLEGLSI